jgi:protein-S-isoprenylcysteine O-methyltransferase Ste14
MGLLFKNVAFTIIVPGTVTVLIPSGIVLARHSAPMADVWGLPQYLALLPMLLSVLMYVRCVWDFATVGHGTPLVFDPPKSLVVRSLYRYVRNPMYLGVLLLLFGEAAFFAFVALLGYATAVFACFDLFVVLIEEPSLRHQFGASYKRYCQNVGRWMPGKRYQETP